MSNLSAYILLFKRDKEPPTFEKMLELYNQIGVSDQVDEEKLINFMEKRKTGDMDEIAQNPGVWSVKKGDKITELRLRKSDNEKEEPVVISNLFGEDDGY